MCLEPSTGPGTCSGCSVLICGMNEAAVFNADSKLCDSLGCWWRTQQPATKFASHHDQRPVSRTLLLHRGGRACNSVTKTRSESRAKWVAEVAGPMRHAPPQVPRPGVDAIFGFGGQGTKSVIQFKFPGHQRGVPSETHFALSGSFKL